MPDPLWQMQSHMQTNGLRKCLHPFMATCGSGDEAQAHAPNFSMGEIYAIFNHAHTWLYESDKYNIHSHSSGLVHVSYSQGEDRGQRVKGSWYMIKNVPVVFAELERSRVKMGETSKTTEA